MMEKLWKNIIVFGYRNLWNICRYNVSGSGTISLQELKIMMEKLGAPQTHLGLKAMIKEVMIKIIIVGIT